VKLLFRNNLRNPPPADFCSFCPKLFKRVPFNADFVAEFNDPYIMSSLPIVHELWGIYLSETLQAL
jgi:hypothetical protein